MKLRTRIQDAIAERLSKILPSAMDTVWDTKTVVVAIEGLSFKPEGGFSENFAHKVSFEGVVRVQLCADDIDALHLEPFLMSLIAEPIILQPHVQEGETTPSEFARLKFKDLKDSIYDQRVVSSLRFDVTGTMGVYDPKTKSLKPPKTNTHLREVT